MLNIILPFFGIYKHENKKYDINLTRDEFRTAMMGLLFSVTLYTFPFQPSKNPIYCVHECVLNDDLTSAMIENLTLNGHKYYLCDEFWKSDFIIPWDCGKHQCEAHYGLDSKYANEKKSAVLNSVCPLGEITKQGYFSVGLLIAFAVWGAHQGNWINSSRNGLLALKRIWKILGKFDICSDCLSKFLVEGILGNEDCSDCIDPCGGVFWEKGTELTRLREKIGPIAKKYNLQTAANCFFCIISVSFIRRYPTEFETWFKCDIPTGHPLLPVHIHMRCLNPDAIVLQGSLYLIIIILVSFFVFFLLCWLNEIEPAIYLGWNRKES